MQFSQILQAAQAANYGMNSKSIGTPPSNQSLQVKTVIPIQANFCFGWGTFHFLTSMKSKQTRLPIKDSC